MGRNILPHDGAMPQVFCFSHLEMMWWGYFYVLLHGQGKEKDRGGDGEGGTAGGETRAWLILTTQGWCFSEPSKTECFVSVHASISPLEKWLTKGLG